MTLALQINNTIMENYKAHFSTQIQNTIIQSQYNIQYTASIQYTVHSIHTTYSTQNQYNIQYTELMQYTHAGKQILIVSLKYSHDHN